jgi:hypothetical protein
MVDGEVWDLDRPLEDNCQLKLLDFDHPEGLAALNALLCSGEIHQLILGG